MRDVFMKRSLSWISAIAMLAAMLCCAISCDKANDEVETTTTAATEAPQAQTVGEGQNSFAFEVVHSDGTVRAFTVKTDADTVGAALVSADLIAGEDGQYGLYVKTVDGETLDYDTHKKYWAFYENGAYAMAGVDKTEIKPNTTYAFRAE